jgi:L-threonylcarbamoyladenylate synthase
VTEVVSISRAGAEAARAAFERCIARGGVAIFPADTLYGLACDPIDERAVSRIRAIKEREQGKPSAVMYFSPLAMRELIARLGPRVRHAVGALLPGPVTLVIANPERRYPLACGTEPSKLGVRLIEGPLGGVTRPVLQTSANHSGEAAPARFDQIDERIVGRADLAIDGGELGGAPSTVIDLSGIDSGAGWSLLREGALTESDVARRLGQLPGRIG